MADATPEYPRVRLDPNKGGYRKSFECDQEDLRNPRDIPFIPTNDWQEIISGQLTPPGLKVRLDITTGKSYGRLLPEKPPVEDLAYLKLMKKELMLTPDETDNIGSTLLHRMCEKGAMDCVEFLVGEKASIGLFNDKGLTPFHIAIMKGSEDVAPFLFNLDKKQLTKNTKQKDEKSPLHLAAYAGSLALVKLLVAAGGKVNAKTKGGDTCLHLAGQRGSLDVLEFMVISCKADLELKNGDDQTAAEVCTDFEKPAAAAWLEQIRSDRVLDALMGDLGIKEDKTNKKVKKPKYVKPAEEKAAEKSAKSKKGKGGKPKPQAKGAAPAKEEAYAPSSGGGSGLTISETQNSKLQFKTPQELIAERNAAIDAENAKKKKAKAPVKVVSESEEDSDKEFAADSDLD